MCFQLLWPIACSYNSHDNLSWDLLALFRLQAGILQLSPGTHFLLDEMALEPGRLEEKGVKNMAALGRVVQWQKVQYDFQYYTTDFSCDLVCGLAFSLSFLHFSRITNCVVYNDLTIDLLSHYNQQ